MNAGKMMLNPSMHLDVVIVDGARRACVIFIVFYPFDFFNTILNMVLKYY